MIIHNRIADGGVMNVVLFKLNYSLTRVLTLIMFFFVSKDFKTIEFLIKLSKDLRSEISKYFYVHWCVQYSSIWRMCGISILQMTRYNLNGHSDKFWGLPEICYRCHVNHTYDYSPFSDLLSLTSLVERSRFNGYKFHQRGFLNN